MRRAKPKVTARQTPSREHVLGSYRHRSGICLLAWALFRGRKKTACADRRLLSDRENTSCPHAPALNELRWTGRLWNQRVQTWATGQCRYKPFRMNDFILMGCQLQPYGVQLQPYGVQLQPYGVQLQPYVGTTSALWGTTSALWGTTSSLWGYTFSLMGYNCSLMGYNFSLMGYNFSLMGYNFS